MPLRTLLRTLAVCLVLTAAGVRAQDAPAEAPQTTTADQPVLGDPGEAGQTLPEQADPPAAGPEAIGRGTEEAMTAAGVQHESGDHGPEPPIWLVIPFVVLLGMIATGPLFYAHHWHHHYPKYAVGLGVLVAAFYLLFLRNAVPVLHAAEEYLSFIALLLSLFVASGCILIRTDIVGTARSNTALLAIGSVISNLIGTTGASMLLIRPYMRINKGRIKPYHIIFFIFAVSNIGGALTPIGDPPLFLGFLRGVPFFWTLAHNWYIWLPCLAIILAVFYVIDARNKEVGVREFAEATGQKDLLEAPVTDETVRPTSPAIPPGGGIQIEGKTGFGWLAVIIVAVFIDPKVFPWVPDLHQLLHVPFGIREVIMFAVAALAFKTAKPEVLRGNEFNFEPIKEVAWLFIGIFLTMQPALTLIQDFAADNAGALNATTFYFGTGILSGFLDNAPTYVAFVAAAMGKFGLDINSPAHVAEFAAVHMSDPQSWYYLQAISIAAVFFGALTYIGNGPNFMVKAIAESSGVQCPSFVGYLVRYSLPILIPIYILIWFIFFSGVIPIHTF